MSLDRIDFLMDQVNNDMEKLQGMPDPRDMTTFARELADLASTATAQAEAYASAIRRHRDQRGDDRCWLDDEELYKVLPEGYTPPARDSRVELALCEKYIACRHNPATEYTSPQRRIEELEAEVARLKGLVGNATEDDIAHAVVRRAVIEFTSRLGEIEIEETAGNCHYCSKPIETVRPGKAQPTCDCYEKQAEAQEEAQEHAWRRSGQ